MAKVKEFLGKRWKKVLAVYVLLVIASQFFLAWKGEDEQVGSSLQIQLPHGILAYQEWGPREGVPLILSHGSPAVDGGDFSYLANELSQTRWVIAPDRTGFGRSSKRAPDYSFIADAKATLALMDELEIEQADLMGWSYGGGVVLEMAQRYPERVRSVGLLAAIGMQEGEGSGNYYIEQLKYEMLRVTLLWLPEAIPHFGLIGPDWIRRSFVRDFGDADQRPMRAIIENLEKPALIVHGKNDPLVPAWAAEEHHELFPNSRLDIVDGSHFFPMGDQGGELGVQAVQEFLTDVDAGQDVVQTNYATKRKRMKALWSGGPEWRGWKPWWTVFFLSGLVAWFRPQFTVFLVTLGGNFLLWDALLGLAGVLLAVVCRKLFLAAKEPEETLRKKVTLMIVNLLAGGIIGSFLLRLT